MIVNRCPRPNFGRCFNSAQKRHAREGQHGIVRRC